jgi:hypothetical protein
MYKEIRKVFPDEIGYLKRIILPGNKLIIVNVRYPKNKSTVIINIEFFLGKQDQ